MGKNNSFRELKGYSDNCLVNIPRANKTRSAPPSPSSGSGFRFESPKTSFDDQDLPQRPPTSISEPPLCCQDFLSQRNGSFDNFLHLGRCGAPPFQGSVKSIGPNCQHVITVVPTSRSRTSDTRKTPARYFVFLEDVDEYQEIDSILSTYLLETTGLDDATETRFTCPSHHQTYQLIRHNRTNIDNKSEASEASDSELSIYEPSPVPSLPAPITEGVGECHPHLSPRQLSLEKRKFMIRKLSYGHKDEMQEIVKNAVIQDKDKERREKWGLGLQESQDREDEAELEKMIEFEVKYCLEKMRVFFVEGGAC